MTTPPTGMHHGTVRMLMRQIAAQVEPLGHVVMQGVPVEGFNEETRTPALVVLAGDAFVHDYLNVAANPNEVTAVIEVLPSEDIHDEALIDELATWYSEQHIAKFVIVGDDGHIYRTFSAPHGHEGYSVTDYTDGAAVQNAASFALKDGRGQAPKPCVLLPIVVGEAVHIHWDDRVRETFPCLRLGSAL